MAENILETHGLCYTYGDGACALRQVTLGIGRGRTTAVLGSNGAGKSTLFLNLNGILKPDAGEVVYRGAPLDYSRRGLLKLRQRVGIVFQDPDSQLFSASVVQDVSFGAVNLKLPEAEIRRRVADALEQTQVAHLKDRPTHSLSFGQKKRVAIAGILVMRPEVLIFDEPTAGLDPQGVSEIMALLRRLQTETGVTLIIATHDIDIVPLYCDYVYVLAAGQVVLEGTPPEVFAAKKTVRSVGLRLPRIAHLMEILQEKDGFDFTKVGLTIATARRLFNQWRERGGGRE
jgi:cobalt/nickel transport system ATP-binding protein